MAGTPYATSICAIAKNEDRYLLEWLAHHLALGFDHVFLYDNMSANPIAPQVAAYGLADRVTVIRWPSIVGVTAQFAAYEHFLHTYGTLAEWTAVIDLDEFINLKLDDDIRAFTARFPAATTIALNWRMFGSSGQQTYKPELLTRRFQRASGVDFHPNHLIKCMYRLRYVQQLGIHSSLYRGDHLIVSPSGERVSNDNLLVPQEKNWAVAQLNHYFTKSHEEWMIKFNRGYADNTVRKDPNVFHEYDRNEFEDSSVLRFAERTRRVMNRANAARRPLRPVARFLARHLPF